MKLLYRATSRFNEITVTKEGDLVTLWSPKGVKQTEIDVRTGMPSLEYARSSMLCLGFVPDPKSILVLGLGGGAIPSLLHSICPGAVIEVIEIDFEMVRVASRFFGFSTGDNIRLYIDDASDHLNRRLNLSGDGEYDIIILDAYLGRERPHHLSTVDFYGKMQRFLSPKGVLVSNLIINEEISPLNRLDSLGALFKKAFLLRCEMSSNALVFCTKEPIVHSTIMSNLSTGMKSTIPKELELLEHAKRMEQQRFSLSTETAFN